jgi:hypothetical protein
MKTITCPVSWERISFTSPKDVDQIYEIAARLGETIVTVVKMVRLLVTNEIDPLPIHQREGTFEFDWNSGPPDPMSDCDLVVAWSYAQAAAKHNQQLLQAPDRLSLRTVLGIFRNTIAWAKFWSIRHPHDGWREKFAEEVAAAEADVRALIATARAKGIEIKELSDG